MEKEKKPTTQPLNPSASCPPARPQARVASGVKPQASSATSAKSNPRNRLNANTNAKHTQRTNTQHPTPKTRPK
ncbi:hypothetical protein HYPSUDRAFT_38994 [Hypholoma sublateritium FD-334 SS-4]|uniref:Uncharacterized protein n=1 Tax=Hypholoma sublateritium (strain FD-334 SS-4) TaxID=945553 RepID=A0A0D2MKJ8_HYPSF|nr:hypothetical protein HYPSUDRAFT_38994 [Hypholoma sublateritium FD-334 SS-4]